MDKSRLEKDILEIKFDDGSKIKMEAQNKSDWNDDTANEPKRK